MSARLKILAYVAAGLAAPFLWTFLESNMISWLPLASSKFMWRTTQVFVGFASAIFLVIPLVLAVRPSSPHYWLPFVGAFLIFELFAIDQIENIVLLFQLPDTWVFLVTSVLLIWWASSRKVAHHAA